MVGEQDKMKGLKQSLPSIIVIAVVVAIWWAAVVITESAIFPTPWAVVTGTLELARDGTLWEHIGASLMRVGAGFGLAVALAIPLGVFGSLTEFWMSGDWSGIPRIKGRRRKPEDNIGI